MTRSAAPPTGVPGRGAASAEPNPETEKVEAAAKTLANLLLSAGGEASLSEVQDVLVLGKQRLARCQQVCLLCRRLKAEVNGVLGSVRQQAAA